MLDKFFVWVGRNRKAISYTVGGMNLLAALSFLLQGSWGLAVLWTVMALFIIIDPHEPV